MDEKKEKPGFVSPEVTDAEIERNYEKVNELFEGKDDETLIKRLTDTIEKVRKWVSENGQKKEPVLPPTVEKLSKDVSLKDENLYYRFAEDALDPFMFWAIDIENDPASYEASNGLVLRVIKDNETSITILDVYYPQDQKDRVEIGTTVIRNNFPSNERQAVNFPHRRLSRLSGLEIRNADVYIRLAQEATQHPRGKENVSPTIRSVV